MRTLNKRAKIWLQDNIKAAAEGDADALVSFRNKAYNRIQANIDSKTGKMLKIYGQENQNGDKRCGYFDPTTTYGGPQESPPSVNDSKKNDRKEYLSSQKDEDQRGARHLLEKQLGIDIQATDRATIHERTILGNLILQLF